MHKLDSPVERWPGHIGLDDPTYPELIRFQDMLDEINVIKAEVEEKGKGGVGLRLNHAILPYLFELTAEWAIEGIEKSVEKFPAKPFKAVDDLIDWWFQAVLDHYLSDEEESKNE